MSPAKIPKPLNFDWDKNNKYKNQERHNVTFKECEEIFFNQPLIISPDKKHSQNEYRLKSLGQTNENRKLFVSYTIRSQKIRVISARDQNKKERRIYGQK